MSISNNCSDRCAVSFIYTYIPTCTVYYIHVVSAICSVILMRIMRSGAVLDIPL